MRTWWLAFLVTACATPAAPVRGSAAELPVAAPRVRVSLVRTTLHATYEPNGMRPSDRTIALRITNDGTTAARLGPIRVAFAAERSGVAFACGAERPSEFHEREPTVLDAGHTVIIEREIDCTMPLPGRYDVRVTATIADELLDAGTAVVDVVANAGRGPRAFSGQPGLYGLVVGDRASRPLNPSAWERGDYRVVVALVNGSKREVHLADVRLGFVVYRLGSEIPCAGDVTTLEVPGSLAAGASWSIHVPLACAPSVEGHYAVVGRLSVAGEEVEAGRFPLLVTDDPLLYGPRSP